MKVPFSQRYGYVKPEKVLIREQLTGAVLNAVINCATNLYNDFLSIQYALYREMEEEFKLHYLNLQYSEFEKAKGPFEYVNDERNAWYLRLDVIEWVIAYHREQIDKLKKRKDVRESTPKNNSDALNQFIFNLNNEFERLGYAYRIIDDVFIETTSSSEMAVIQESLKEADANSVTHLQECLRLLSPSNQELSTRNAIKEAISAVEVTARQITDTKTLDDAFKSLREIHPMIRLSMEKLYHYTNQKDTGIRHGWMEQSDEPTINEAIFVLVTSCSFINYLNKVLCNSEHK